MRKNVFGSDFSEQSVGYVIENTKFLTFSLTGIRMDTVRPCCRSKDRSGGNETSFQSIS